MRGISKFLHLFSIIVWFGGAIFLFAFVAIPIFKSFPVEQAGDLMAVIFPGYYHMQYAAGIIAILTLYFGWKKKPWFRLLLIMLMLLSTVYGGMIVGKKVSELRISIKQEEDLNRKAVLKENFHTQHRLSMISNGFVIILIPIIVFLTSRKLSDG